MNQEMSHGDLSDVKPAGNVFITTNINTTRIHVSFLLSDRMIFTLWCLGLTIEHLAIIR